MCKKKKIYIMYGEYTCPFINYFGEICGRSCMREEGCSIYWKYVLKLADKQRTPCKECIRLRDLEIQNHELDESYQFKTRIKFTRSYSGLCPIHIKGFYVSQYYHRLRSRALMNGK